MTRFATKKAAIACWYADGHDLDYQHRPLVREGDGHFYLVCLVDGELVPLS